MPPRRSEDAEEVPYVPPRPSAAASSGTRQQSEDVEEVPYMPPMGANTADDETPHLDSFPSTPRAVSEVRETVTLCGAASLEADRPIEEPYTAAITGVAERASTERVAADAGEHPPGAAAQSVSATEQSANAAQPPGSAGTN